jgi:adenylate kinase family enzyme
MTATDYLKTKWPHSHTLPHTAIIDLMEGYWQHRKELYEKARDSFNSEKWVAEHNIETLRQKFKNDKDHQK